MLGVALRIRGWPVRGAWYGQRGCGLGDGWTQHTPKALFHMQAFISDRQTSTHFAKISIPGYVLECNVQALVPVFWKAFGPSVA